LSVRIVLCLVTCGLLGCASNSPAPIEDRGGAQLQPAHPTHTVKRGDTLYSIAFRYGMDFRTVAAANGIAPPYTIYPGQQIRLSPSPQAVSAAPASTYPVAIPHASVPQPAPPPVPAPRTAPAPRPVPPPALANSPLPPAAPEAATPLPAAAAEQSVAVIPAPVPVPVPAPVPAREPSQETPKPKSGAESFNGEKVTVWRWPTSGPVTRGYSESVHKGIDIGGARGDAVTAVAAGKVVYAGTGIAGFGELLIIKHNDVYLSAYGHNEELLVAEGDTVVAGQTIAQKGSSGTDAVKLHFEIRQEGKPIDPQRLLPGR
jgi:lipoprotein NlpD